MSQKNIFLSIVAVLMIIGIAAYWKFFNPGSSSVPIPVPNAAITDKNTVAHQWRWENFSDAKSNGAEKPTPQETTDNQNKTSSREEVPYDVVQIYDMLQQVRLDENGNVLIDTEAKLALEKAFTKLGPDMNFYAISQLQELIEIGLPGPAGEQTAEILAQFYDYRLAEEELLAQSKASSSDEEAENYERLVELRRSYLGPEVADKLYAEQEIRSRHMFASMNLLSNPDLSDEEKQQKQRELKLRLNEQLVSRNLIDPEFAVAERVSLLREQGASDSDIYNARVELVGVERAQSLASADKEQDQWQQRLDRYWQERQQIAQAGLSDADQQQQIELLLARHFSGEEVNRARNSRPQETD